MELFVKIVNSLMLLTIFTKSSILDVCLGSKNDTERCFIQNCCKHLWKPFWKINSDVKCAAAVSGISSAIKKKKTLEKEKTKNFYYIKFYFFQHSKTIFKFCCTRFYFYANEYLGENKRKYANLSLSLRRNNSVWWFQKRPSSF